MFEAAEYNNEFQDTAAILMHINDKLIEQQRESSSPNKKKGQGAAAHSTGRQLAGRGAQANPDVSVATATESQLATIRPVNIFQKIQHEKQARMARQNQKDQARRNQSAQMNSYQLNRQSKGVCRETYNAAVNRIPGLYNEHC